MKIASILLLLISFSAQSAKVPADLKKLFYSYKNMMVEEDGLFSWRQTEFSIISKSNGRIPTKKIFTYSKKARIISSYKLSKARLGQTQFLRNVVGAALTQIKHVTRKHATLCYDFKAINPLINDYSKKRRQCIQKTYELFGQSLKTISEVLVIQRQYRSEMLLSEEKETILIFLSKTNKSKVGVLKITHF